MLTESDFNTLYISFIQKLDEILNEYLTSNSIQKQYHIMVVGFDSLTMSEELAKKYYTVIWLRPIMKTILYHLIVIKVFYSIWLELWHTRTCPDVSNIIFQEPFYLPSLKLVENYFQHIESGKVINFGSTLNDNMNLFGVNKTRLC